MSRVYTPRVGESIDDAAKAMLAIAIRERKRVTGVFNGAPLLADPGMSWQQVRWIWDRTRKLVWSREAKQRGARRRQERKQTKRRVESARKFVERVRERNWGLDPVGDLNAIEPWLDCLGWTFTTPITQRTFSAIAEAYPKTDFKDCGVETADLFAAWLLGNAATMWFDGPTKHFFKEFHRRFPCVRYAEPEDGDGQ